eukprot:SM000003S11065  [mRNA]  locus=s3:594763:595647:- [translate_table: standard]
MADYRRITVKGVTALEQAGRHTIRVFAQVEGACRQSMATQGDAACCYLTPEDACETGCAAACERASAGASLAGALQDCQDACTQACVRPEAGGKFSAVVLSN